MISIALKFEFFKKYTYHIKWKSLASFSIKISFFNSNSQIPLYIIYIFEICYNILIKKSLKVEKTNFIRYNFAFFKNFWTIKINSFFYNCNCIAFVTGYAVFALFIIC